MNQIIRCLLGAIIDDASLIQTWVYYTMPTDPNDGLEFWLTTAKMTSDILKYANERLDNINEYHPDRLEHVAKVC